VLDDALTDLEQRLGERLLRIHRNALVARKALLALERRVLPGEGDEKPPKAGWCAWRRSMNGSWCRAARWRR
jgi:two-component system response regulator AlgR